ncbi:NADP-dependent oxidoreductase [Amycolatopsis sp. NPDC005232]|uniref:NADP-dependent oxidoreductase n=1 Tax=Amycolatopsis sp. NPDC005232 TaxID=3157027 RepID=UPI0033AA71FF
MVLAEEPIGHLSPDHFTITEGPVPYPLEREVLVRVVYAQVRPGARAVMTTTTAFPRTRPGDGIFTAVVGEVVESPDSALPLGTIVTGYGVWEEYLLAPASAVRPVAPRKHMYEHLGLLGMNGLTAYFGVTALGRIRPGSTFVVSAAAGGVGHVAGQIAKVLGARVVGITGSTVKNETLVDDLGFAAAVDRRSATFADRLIEACPDGVDVYFDNVGGPLLDTLLPLMNRNGRVVCCGTTSAYDSAEDAVVAPGPRGIPQILINKSLHLEGLLVANFAADWPSALEQLAGWADDGKIVPLTDVRNGLDSAPQALVDLLEGKNLGQMVVQIAPEEDPLSAA